MSSKRIINPNFRHLVNSHKDGVRGSVLIGSSRSGKTWSGIDFIIYLVSHSEEKLTINIIRETYNSFKTTLYEDFNNRLPMFGIQSPFQNIQEKSSFHLLGCKINLIGADKPNKFLGAGCDYMFVNEANHVPKSVFDQAEMRCSKYWWMDFNPEHTKHWIYDNIMKRPDVSVLRTTFMDNPFVPIAQKKKIQSYEPTPENIKNGTADAYMWKVYGLGEIAEPRGLVYKHWEKYDELPDSVSYRVFGVDWGGVDPTAFGEINFDWHNRAIYIREHLYEPDILNSDLINLILKKNPTNDEVICDSARRDKIYELQMADINAMGATKGEGSIVDGIDKVREFKIYAHKDSHNLHSELNSYKYVENKETGGYLNKPEDKNNHLLDLVRYCVRYYINAIKGGL